MKHSLTYYITLWVLKLKGIKKDFSKDPIDYKKIRKEDVYVPKGRFFRNYVSDTFKALNTDITEIQRNKAVNKLLIFVHGGAFISGPAKHHWDTIKEIVNHTEYTVWMCNYPKAPEHKITEISENIDAVYTAALETYPATAVTLIGDSAGGGLITALVQRILNAHKDAPRQIILVSPVMDATMSNPQIQEIDSIDPMLGKAGVLSAKKMCATDLKDVRISPLYGSFDRFPNTVLFLATHDITYPDQLLVVEKLQAAGVDLRVITGNGMPHIWPFLPVMKEAKTALRQILKELNG